METARPRHRPGDGTCSVSHEGLMRDLRFWRWRKAQEEELRDMRTGAALDRLGREMRHAARRLVRTPAFTVTTVLTLALAIGANVAIFAVVYRVVVNPLPYGDSHRLIALDNGMPSRNISFFNSHTTQLYYQYVY